MSNHITSLHNYLQKRKELGLLTWVETSSGPSNEAVWTVQCKVGGVVMGAGTGPSKADARHLAAEQALQELRSTYPTN